MRFDDQRNGAVRLAEQRWKTGSNSSEAGRHEWAFITNSLFHDALKSIGCSRCQPSGADRCQSILCPINRWGTSAFQCVCETFDMLRHSVILQHCLAPLMFDSRWYIALCYLDIRDPQMVNPNGFGNLVSIHPILRLIDCAWITQDD